MDAKKIRNTVLLLITALIWGTAFVAQSEGGKEIGPFSFNGIRSVIGGIVLIPVIIFMDKTGRSGRKPVTKEDKKRLMTGGILCGVILFLGSSLQQLGLYLGTTAGKAGFLTACYILIVPILGIFLKKRCGINVWCGVVLTIVGLYLLCMTGEVSLKLCDAVTLSCALVFALHILAVDYYSPLVDGVRMSCIQFFTCGILCSIVMLITEMKNSFGGISELASNLTSFDAWLPILYAGILSCGVGYTLQIIGQEGLNPTIASLLMSLESVFSVIAGWLILDQSLTPKEIVGCVIIFVAILMAQIPFNKKVHIRFRQKSRLKHVN